MVYYNPEEDEDAVPFWAWAAAGGVAAGVAWYLYRSSQRKDLIKKLSSSASVQQAVEGGWVDWSIEDKASELITLSSKGSAEDGYIDVLTEIRSSTPVELKEEDIIDLSDDAKRVLLDKLDELNLEDSAVAKVVQSTQDIAASAYAKLPDIPDFDASGYVPAFMKDTSWLTTKEPG